jgi:hypothetical protein
MSRPYSGCYASLRTHSADLAAMQSLVDGAEDNTAECPECLGLGGSWSYPNAMSRIWHDCDNGCDDGRIPL